METEKRLIPSSDGKNQDASEEKQENSDPMRSIWVTGSPDLADYSTMKGLLQQFNPQVHTDITAMEKGMESFIMFNHSHLALFDHSRMQYLNSREIQYLKEKNIIDVFEYINIDQGGDLYMTRVLLRPASLKGSMVDKAKNACIRGSVLSIIKYIVHRNANLVELEKKGKLTQAVSRRLQDTGKSGISLKNFNSLSFDNLIESVLQPDPRLFYSVLELLSMPATDLYTDLQLNTDLAEDIRPIMELYGSNPIIIKLENDFHLAAPRPDQLVDVDGDKVKDFRCELEYIHVLFVKMARKILQKILPDDEQQWIKNEGITQDQKYLEELRKHPAFIGGEKWKGADTFLVAYESIIQEVRKLQKIRSEFLIRYLATDVMKKVSGMSEPYYLTPSVLTEESGLARKIQNTNESLFLIILRQLEGMEDVLLYESPDKKDEGVYILHRFNMPRLFIANPGIRTMIHSAALANQYEKGIYDFLLNVNPSTHPKELVNEQIELSKAIRQWEESLDQTKKKSRKRKNHSVLQRLGRFFSGLLMPVLRLFGVHPPRESDGSDTDMPDAALAPGSDHQESRKTGVLVGPKEKKIILPPDVQRSIDYVERHNNGIIWLDQVVRLSDTSRFDENTIGDMLFYDNRRRYIEIRPLVKLRRAFISKDNEADKEWRTRAIEYLENITQKDTSTIAMLNYLRKRNNEDAFAYD